ncbi:MAG: T9SS type A sorting domain-containing protein [Bacteroidetes bacterium]|nr:T9SS type A sorting domain-containing protein [Bacteroidota bacterium]
MKKIFTLLLAIGLCFQLVAQIKPVFPKEKRHIKELKPIKGVNNPVVGTAVYNGIVSTKGTMEDPIVAMTNYDFQTNGAPQNRLFLFPDGTISATTTLSHDIGGAFPDRGAGYNYFDGSVWGPQPAARIESVRTGWPSVCPWGTGGEAIITHQSATEGLVLNTRPTKGSGAWTESFIPPPTGASGMIWSRMISSGPDNMYLHVLCLTAPVANGGVIYQGLDGALVYNRSLDGGATWDGWQILDGMDDSEYLAFSADAYAWAEPHGDTLCFVTGDNWYDQFIMRSNDNGDNWTKTVIWSCPFNLWAGGDTTGNFNCPDGSSTVQLDNSGKAHVVFGYMRANGDEAGAKYWFPWTDGLLYWNEDMPELPQELDSATLMANGNYIGWLQDPEVWQMQATQLAYYYMSMSTYPNIITDDYNNLFVVWSSVTTLTDPNDYLLRHIFGRASIDGGQTWRDTIVDITGDFLYTWSECVYPSMAQNSTDKLFILFQADPEAGTYLMGSSGAQGQTSITNNDITFLNPDKNLLIQPSPGINETEKLHFLVSAIYPNPVRDAAKLHITLKQRASITATISNTMGQMVHFRDFGELLPGTHPLQIDAGMLRSGVYFYTVNANGQSVTKKMIVD